MRQLGDLMGTVDADRIVAALLSSTSAASQVRLIFLNNTWQKFLFSFSEIIEQIIKLFLTENGKNSAKNGKVGHALHAVT